MKKNNEFLKAVLVWICAAGVILALLVPCFSLIWRDRNRTHTRDECRLLADAILKQSNVEQKRIRKNEQFLQTYLSTLNALSGWAYAYGGTDEQELALIHIKHGEIVKKFPEEELIGALRYELEHWGE